MKIILILKTLKPTTQKQKKKAQNHCRYYCKKNVNINKTIWMHTYLKMSI